MRPRSNPPGTSTSSRAASHVAAAPPTPNRIPLHPQLSESDRWYTAAIVADPRCLPGNDSRPLIGPLPLEQELESELANAGIARPGDTAETRARKRTGRVVEI